MRPNKLYMVIPCYNEEEVLPETARRLREKLTALMEAGTISPESRVLFVNDGSKDHTWEIIARLHQENPLFSGVCLSRNRGHQNALLDTESLQLDTPEDVWLYEEDGYLCLEYSHVDANDGYYVVVYKGSDRLLSVYTDVDEEQLVLTEMDPSWQGKRFYAKVKALGSVYDSTEDSEFGDSETFRWE